MFRGMFLFAASYIALLVFHVHFLFYVNCDTNNQNQQQQLLHKNSCGDVHNISFPFRLKSDPLDNCGDKNFELECQNNRTLLYLYSAFVSCEKPVKSPLYIDTSSKISTAASCEIKGEGVSSSSAKKHSYVLVGSYYSLNWSDVEDLCSVDMVFPTRRRNITSLLEVHNALADGFDLSWGFYDYKQCIRQAHCFSNYDQNATVGACSGRPYGIWAVLGASVQITLF
ncbi:uncharacterized protein LOC114285753 [Camellia sinensis]|uniref:uncharacterized protein LOC114285753 n=1 Tax=Camellia sinensis TaxID=4442 RepID=UPI0010366357|nr:uncharacterized protein LOC114285753 [Camellia sinensis]